LAELCVEDCSRLGDWIHGAGKRAKLARQQAGEGDASSREASSESTETLRVSVPALGEAYLARLPLVRHGITPPTLEASPRPRAEQQSKPGGVGKPADAASSRRQPRSGGRHSRTSSSSRSEVSGVLQSVGGWKVGQRVAHDTFGEGVIEEVSGNDTNPLVEVRFTDGSKRRLIASRAPLSAL
ncbi:MAG: hypothetical protein ACTH7C_03315, partial [Cobetia marina]